MFNIRDINHALRFNYLQDFHEQSTSGIFHLLNLSKKPSLNKMYWLHYALITSYNIGCEDIALHIWRKYDPTGVRNYYSPDLIMFSRCAEGRVYEAAAATYYYRMSGYSVLPINILLSEFSIDAEYNNPDDTDNMGMFIIIIYEEFKTKPNEFGQISNLYNATRFAEVLK